MRIIGGIVLLSFLLLISGCRKGENPLSWNTDHTVPLLYGSLGIEDLIPDSLVAVGGDSSIILAYEGQLLNVDASEFLILPDTSIVDTFQVPFPTAINLSPGQVFINIPEEQNLQIPEVSLAEVKVHKGVIEYELTSTVKGIVTYVYEIPSATDPAGDVFSETITVPAASPGNVSTVSGSFSLDGYSLDMRGQSGVDYNRVLTNINCKIADANTEDITVVASDNMIVSNEFKNVVIETAKGYFGQHTVSTGLDFASFEGFSKWISGSIDIDNVEVGLAVKNGLGVDALIRLNQLQASGINGSISLSHSLIGELISLTRATRYYDTIIPSVYEATMNKSNSNIDDFLEVLPKQIGYDIDVEVNPLGNVSGYNDFYDRNAPMGVYVNATMPLSFVADQLTLEDTLSIAIDEASSVNDMVLTLEVENGFPLGANVEFAILDVNENIISRIFSPEEIPAADLGVDGRVTSSASSVHQILINGVDMQRIQSNGRLLLTVEFNTPGNDFVTLYNHYHLDYKLKADANVTITLNGE